MIKAIILNTIKVISLVVSMPILFFVFLFFYLNKKMRSSEVKKPRLVWGTDPLINNKYWSKAMQLKGFSSTTLMSGVYIINKKDDYDLYYEDIVPVFIKKLPGLLQFPYRIIHVYILLLYVIRKFDIVHLPLHGFILRNTFLWNWEAQIFKLFGLKTVILPYGGDFYEYSKVPDLSLRHALNISYPAVARNETVITRKKHYWNKHADATITGSQTEGMGRWDSLPIQFVTIDEKQWKPRAAYSRNDGVNGVVKISHTPNHRGFKGTEFLLKAIEELQQEGLLIELILIEKKPNEEVRRILENHVDIHAEQFVVTAYALSAIEGMACGLPVLANLDNEDLTRVFRRYSFLNECPILSTTIEQIKGNLKILIKNPTLREQLGKAGRKYVEKYHSDEAAQFLFENIYDKIWFGKEVDLINLYHPLYKSSLNNKSPLVDHPLFENKFIQN
jgi:glycosyltransferase involved in cell wall biosynthesis